MVVPVQRRPRWWHVSIGGLGWSTGLPESTSRSGICGVGSLAKKTSVSTSMTWTPRPTKCCNWRQFVAPDAVEKAGDSGGAHTSVVKFGSIARMRVFDELGDDTVDGDRRIALQRVQQDVGLKRELVAAIDDERNMQRSG